jgi:hypothetical protein
MAICPHCKSKDVMELMSIYHCNGCGKPFTKFEETQGRIIDRLLENIEELTRENSELQARRRTIA